MQNAMHVLTHVLPGHRVEVTSPQLIEGQAVDVFLVPREQTSRSAMEIIRSLKGRRLFQSPEEVDRHLKQERDTWDH